jgi:hypothetical protein
MDHFHNIFHSYVQYHSMIFQWYSNAIIQQDFTALMMWKKQQSSWNVIIFNIPMGQWNFASNGAFKGSCVLDQLEPGLRARPNWLSHWLSQTLRGRTRTWQRFLNWGYPNGWMVYFMENLFFSGMVLGVPHFRKPPYQLHYDFVCSDIHLQLVANVVGYRGLQRAIHEWSLCLHQRDVFFCPSF